MTLIAEKMTKILISFAEIILRQSYLILTKFRNDQIIINTGKIHVLLNESELKSKKFIFQFACIYYINMLKMLKFQSIFIL